MRPRSSTFAICLEKRRIAKQMLEGMNQVLTNKGMVLREGISLDASILIAPSSTKNKRKERDPEIHSVGEGKQREPRFSGPGLKEVPGPAPWAPLAGGQPRPPWEWRGARSLGRGEQPRPALGLCPFPVPRTPPPFAENPVFPLICAQPCSAGDLNVFHRLDRLRGSRQSRGVRKRSSDRLQRRPSRGPLSPLAGDTY